MNLCSEPGCDKPVCSLGLCSAHYERQRRRAQRGVCRKCGKPKPEGPGRKLCDECLVKVKEAERERRREYARQYYAENRERVLARLQAKYDEDPDGYRERKAREAREWALKHPEEARENRRRHWAKRKYGLTLEELEAILARGCAICGNREGSIVGPRGYFKDAPEPRLCIDHDHANGKVRDALCHKCNGGLGWFDDNPALLRAAADYLEAHGFHGQASLPGLGS